MSPRSTTRAVALLIVGTFIAVTLWPHSTIAVAGQASLPDVRRVDPGSPESNKDLVRQWVEVWNTGELDAIGGLLAPDFVRHDPNAPDVHGPAEERQFVAAYLAAIPDLHVTIDALIAEGDTVAARLTAVGTQRGDLFGIPPTGKTVRVGVAETYRIADGKIAEQWVVMDALGMLRQLGAVPATA